MIESPRNDQLESIETFKLGVGDVLRITIGEYTQIKQIGWDPVSNSWRIDGWSTKFGQVKVNLAAGSRVPVCTNPLWELTYSIGDMTVQYATIKALTNDNFEMRQGAFYARLTYPEYIKAYRTKRFTQIALMSINEYIIRFHPATSKTTVDI